MITRNNFRILNKGKINALDFDTKKMMWPNIFFHFYAFICLYMQFCVTGIEVNLGNLSFFYIYIFYIYIKKIAK